MKAASPFWDSPVATLHSALSGVLLWAFPGYPKVTPPTATATKGERI